MKKILFFALILLAVVSCKKEKDTDPSDPTVDAREAFIGEYEHNVNANVNVTTSNETIAGLIPTKGYQLKKTFDMKIEKDPAASNRVIISGFYNCTALVSGNNLVLESTTETKEISMDNFIDYDLLKNVKLPITYSLVHKTATLDGNTLTWHTDATGTGSVNIYIMTVDFQGDADIENTATKK